MRSISADVRHAAAGATLQFDWLLPEKPFFRVSELTGRLELGTTKIEELFEQQCHRWPVTSRRRDRAAKNASAQGKALGDAKEGTMRIPRAFVVAALIASARYAPEDKVQAVTGLAPEFTADQCREIAAAFISQAERARR